MINSINICNNPNILQGIYIVKIVLKVMLILVPVIIIVTSIMSFSKSVISGDDADVRSSMKLLLVKIFIGAFIFFIPTIVNAFFSVIEKSDLHNSFLSCYTNATPSKINELKKNTVNTPQNPSNDINNQQHNNNQDPNYPDNNNQNNNEITNITKDMYIGDSRTVGIFFTQYSQNYTNTIEYFGPNEYWYASVGMGYNWFNSSAISKIKSKLHENYNVFIMMGANDLYNVSLAQSYVNTINTLAKQYPNSNFVIVSVNPIDDNKSVQNGYSVNNNQVILFNNSFKQAVSSANTNVKYCDTYSKIIGSFTTTDGIHYDTSTSKTVYTLIKACA